MAQRVLVYVLDQFLRLLHPFMPFITEEIWQAIPHEGDTLICSSWPVYQEALNFKTEEMAMESVMNVIRSVRNHRSEMNVPPSKKCTLYLVTKTPEIFQAASACICRLAFADELVVLTEKPAGYEDMASCLTHDATMFMPMRQLVDFDKELERICKEKEKAQQEVARLEGKLSNEKFVSRAPEAVVAAERAKLEKAQALLAQLCESETRFQKLS